MACSLGIIIPSELAPLMLLGGLHPVGEACQLVPRLKGFCWPGQRAEAIAAVLTLGAVGVPQRLGLLPAANQRPAPLAAAVRGCSAMRP